MQKTCIKCGSTDRTPRGDCRACAKAYMKAWHEKNAAHSKAQRAAWIASHTEEIAAYNKAYREANLDTLKTKQNEKRLQNTAAFRKREAEWRARYFVENPDKLRARNTARNARMTPQKRRDAYHANPTPTRLRNQNRRARLAGGKLSAGLVERLLKKQNGLCACCNVPLEGKFHLDHVMPLALGGANTDDNIQLLLPICNLRKKDKHPEVFMRERAAARQSTGN